MTAANLNLTIERYATFSVELQVKTPSGDTTIPDDITGYVPRMQVRAAPESTEVLLELHTGNGRITVVDAITGKLRLTISAADTTNLNWTTGVYDLILVGQDKTRRLLAGAVAVSPGVTR
jgi:hypothetical protein